MLKSTVCGKKFFQKVNLITRPPSVPSAAGLALIFLLIYHFKEDIYFIIVWPKIIMNNS